MKYWFTTSDGNTVHNQPGTPNFIPGEPPIFPKTKINYREKCLRDGFARIGYPNTGDLIHGGGLGRIATNGYSFETVEDVSKSNLTKNQLINFSKIQAGDYIMIPSDEGIHLVHFGIVFTRNKEPVKPYMPSRPEAYFFYHNIKNEDFYECSHRVNVKWAKDEKDDYAIIYLPEIGGAWRQAFAQLHQVSERLQNFIHKYALWNIS